MTARSVFVTKLRQRTRREDDAVRVGSLCAWKLGVAVTTHDNLIIVYKLVEVLIDAYDVGDEVALELVSYPQFEPR